MIGARASHAVVAVGALVAVAYAHVLLEVSAAVLLLPADRPTIRSETIAVADLTPCESARPKRELIELVARLGVLEPIIVPDVDEKPSGGSARRRATRRSGTRDGGGGLIVSGAGTRPASVRVGAHVRAAREPERLARVRAAGDRGAPRRRRRGGGLGEADCRGDRHACADGAPPAAAQSAVALAAGRVRPRGARPTVPEAAAKLTAAQQVALERHITPADG